VILCGIYITAELMASHNSHDLAARSSTAAGDVRFAAGVVTAGHQQHVMADQLQQQRLMSSLGILSSSLPISAGQLQVTVDCHN